MRREGLTRWREPVPGRDRAALHRSWAPERPDDGPQSGKMNVRRPVLFRMETGAGEGLTRMTDVPVDADTSTNSRRRGGRSKPPGTRTSSARSQKGLSSRCLTRARSARGSGCWTSEPAQAMRPPGPPSEERRSSASTVESMLALARRHHPELDFRQGDVEALPFPDQSFDAVVGNFIMLHLGRPEQAVAEFVRVLAPSGRLALTVWDVPEKARILGVMVDAVGAAGASAPEEIPAGPPIFRFSEEREFDRLLREQARRNRGEDGRFLPLRAFRGRPLAGPSRRHRSRPGSSSPRPTTSNERFVRLSTESCRSTRSARG